MAESRIKAFDSSGKPHLVPPEELNDFKAEGGREATPEEIAERKLDAEYGRKSGLEKVVGLATGVGLPPQAAAFQQGAQSGLTAGLGPGALYQGLKALNPKAAQAYKENVEELSTGYPGTESVGKGAGFVGSIAATGGLSALGKAAGATAAARAGSWALPAASIGRVGQMAAESGLVEAGVHALARGGALGRAAGSALELGVQGGVEGAMFGAADKVGEQMLEDSDHETMGEKLWAVAQEAGHGALFGSIGGAALGGATSLAGTAIRGGVNAAKGLSRIKELPEEIAARAASKVDEVANEATTAAKGAVNKIEEAANLNHEQEVDSFHKMLSNAAEPAAQKGIAYDMAFRSVGDKSMAGKFAKEAEARLKPIEGTTMLGGSRGIGETLLRQKVIDSDMGVVSAFANGTVKEILPRVTAAREIVGKQLGDIAAESGATFNYNDFGKIIDREARKWEGQAALRHVGTELRQFGEDMTKVIAEKGYQADQIPIQEMILQRQGLDARIYGDARALDAKSPLQGLRDMRAAFQDKIIERMDQAAEEAGTSGLKQKIRELNHDYQALSIAEKAAEDGAAKAARTRGLSLTDYLAAAATGHIGLAPIAAVANMLARTRGNAAGAVLISRMADTGAITKAIRAFDDQVGRTAKGVLAPSAAGTTGIAEESVRARALKVISAVHDAQANPEEVAGKVAEHADTIAQVAPQIAQGYSKAATQSMAYIASQMPQPVKLDPLALNQSPIMSNAEMSRIARVGLYAGNPMQFFRDAERGLVTPEGVDAAKAMMPKAFAELQMKTLEAIYEHQKAGKPLALAQRLRASMLLDIEGDASARPDMIQFMQDNVSQPPPKQDKAPSGGGGHISMDAPQNPYDRLENRGSKS